MKFSESLRDSAYNGSDNEFISFGNIVSDNKTEHIEISESGKYILCDSTTGEVIESLEATIYESKKKLKELGKDKYHPKFMSL